MQTSAAPRDRTPAAFGQPAQATATPELRLAPGGEIVHGALGCPSRDELAQQDICAALLSAPDLDARHVEVVMTAAGVLLRGTIASAGERERALRIATRVAAPRSVRDALTLVPGTDTRQTPPPTFTTSARDAG